MARIRAVLRRAERRPGPVDHVTLGALELDPESRRVTVDGEPVHLTPTECDPLRGPASRPGAVRTREQLLADVWAGATATACGRRLPHPRAAPQARLPRVRTVHGIGYALEP